MHFTFYTLLITIKNTKHDNDIIVTIKYIQNLKLNFEMYLDYLFRYL